MANNKIRVIAKKFDDISAGKLIAFEPISIEQLCLAATTKLIKQDSDEVGTFTRVFLPNGIEVVDIDAIRDDDELIFTYGDDLFVSGKSSPSNPSDASLTDNERNRFLHKLTQAAVVQASQLYDTTSTYVKNKSPEFIKQHITKVETKAMSMLQTPSSVVSQHMTNVVDWADNHLDHTIVSLRRRSSKIMNLTNININTINNSGDWAKIVNHSLLITMKSKLSHPKELFYAAAQESFQYFNELSTLTSEQFILLMQTKLGISWNESLIEPVRKLYESGKQEYDNLRMKGLQYINHEHIQQILSTTKTKLGNTWEHTIITTLNDKHTQIMESLNTKLKQPADAFYRFALECYDILIHTGNGQVTLIEFVAGLRVKLGTLWNDKLRQPASTLFELFKKHTNMNANTNININTEQEQQDKEQEQQEQEQEQQLKQQEDLVSIAPSSSSDKIEDEAKEQTSAVFAN